MVVCLCDYLMFVRLSCVTGCRLSHQHCPCDFVRSFVRSGHFYSAPSSPLLLRGAPDYSTDTVSEFHAEAHRQLQVKDLLSDCLPSQHWNFSTFIARMGV